LDFLVAILSFSLCQRAKKISVRLLSNKTIKSWHVHTNLVVGLLQRPANSSGN
jgi:hypothetical protein